MPLTFWSVTLLASLTLLGMALMVFAQWRLLQWVLDGNAESQATPPEDLAERPLRGKRPRLVYSRPEATVDPDHPREAA